MKNKFLQSTLSLLLLCSFSFVSMPALVSAQNTGTQTTNPNQTNSNQNGTGGGLNQNGQTTNTGGANTNTTSTPGAGQSLATSAASCSVGSLLGNIVGGTLGAVLGSITGAAGDFLKDLGKDATSEYTNPSAYMRVKVEAPTLNTKTDKGNQLTANQVQKEVDSSANNGSIWDGIVDSISAPGLDAIGFCIANEMIRYIADSTIAWINNGFEGSPVFVDNPEGYFNNIADREASAFIQSVAGKATEGAFGGAIDICKPFKVQLSIDTIGAYNSRYPKQGGQRLNCTLDKLKSNYEGFTGGDWNAGGWQGWFEILKDENNIYGSRILAQNELNARIDTKKNTAVVELNWAKGYKNFKICLVDKLPDGSCPNSAVNEKTTTLGGYIENQVNSRGASGLKRLEIADEFDEIVSALVNELIKIAVNKAFENDDGTQK